MGMNGIIRNECRIITTINTIQTPFSNLEF